VARAKCLWLQLIRDLSWRGLIDAPPDAVLATLSTSELIGQLKHTMAGPTTWACESTAPLATTRQYTVPLDVVEGRMRLYRSHERLLPGGRYIMFRTWDGLAKTHVLEFWAVEPPKRMWSFELIEALIHDVKLDAGAMRGGKITVLLVLHEARRCAAYSRLGRRCSLVPQRCTHLGSRS
jgi:hypothetical protein